MPVRLRRPRHKGKIPGRKRRQASPSSGFGGQTLIESF
jgi:hypothetical protein